MPTDLSLPWQFTSWSLCLYDWLHISFVTYPPPACFDQARLYEAKSAEVAAQRAAMKAPKARKRPPAPPEQARMEL